MIRLAARARSIEEAEQCLALGFDLLEITLPCPGGPEEERAWSEFSGRHQVAYLAHGPEEGNPFDLARLKREYMPRLRQALAAAERLGCLGLTVHFWLDSRWIKLPAADIQDKVSLLARVAAWGASAGMPVNLENLSEDWTDLERPLAAIPDLGLTLDVGHAQLLRPENAAPGIIVHLFGRLRHLHLHDNHGGRSSKDDLHLIPGQGQVPLARIFGLLKERGYDRTATLELRPHEMAAARDWVTRVWEQA